MLAALLLALLPPVQSDVTALGRPVVETREVDGQATWSVAAKNAPLHRVLHMVAESWSAKTLEFEVELDRSTLVTAQLIDRPVAEVLDYVLGSVGLDWEARGNRLVIVPLMDPARNAEEALLMAESQWLLFLRRFPAAPEAPGALMSLAELQELRGLTSGAREQYESLLETYPDAAEVPEALLRSGRLFEREANFGEAARVYASLAGRGDAAAYTPAAFLRLAACRVELGQAQEALYILDLLDGDYPPADPALEGERLLVRAAALNGLGRWMDALRQLDRAGRYLDPWSTPGASRIRAIAMSGAGYKAEASRAWLQFADDCRDSEREFAFVQAAELALEAEDELSVLFITRQANLAGVDSPALQELTTTAEQRLGLIEAVDPELADVPTKLARLEALVEEGKLGEVRPTLEQLYRGRGSLAPDAMTRTIALYARVTALDMSLDDALAVLREERALMENDDTRRPLDREAARLLEAASLWERAADAYEGRY